MLSSAHLPPQRRSWRLEPTFTALHHCPAQHSHCSLLRTKANAGKCLSDRASCYWPSKDVSACCKSVSTHWTVVLLWGVCVAIPSLQILGWFEDFVLHWKHVIVVCLFPKSTFLAILCLLQHCRRNIAAPSVCPQWPITASCLYLQQSLFISYLIFTISVVVLLFNIGIHHNLSQTWPFLTDLWQQKHSLLHLSVCNVTMKEYYNHQCLLTDFFTCDSGRHSRVSQNHVEVDNKMIWAGACLIDFCCLASSHTFIRSSYYGVFYNIWPCVVSWLPHISPWSSLCHI